ncbi:MAG: hypothetical protein ACRD5W_12165, partial [Candidatus Acidiferrales bacterium]
PNKFDLTLLLGGQNRRRFQRERDGSRGSILVFSAPCRYEISNEFAVVPIGYQTCEFERGVEKSMRIGGSDSLGESFQIWERESLILLARPGPF